jgi:hypothetical protein
MAPAAIATSAVGRTKTLGKHCIVFGMIFVKNSPLQPVFMSTSVWIQERGIHYKLMRKWEGYNLSEDWNAETVVLTPGQLIIPFTFILLDYIYWITILSGELVIFFV